RSSALVAGLCRAGCRVMSAHLHVDDHRRTVQLAAGTAGALPCRGISRGGMAIAFNSQMRPRMRITFVLPDASLAGGIRVVAIYAAKLHARGHKVTVISTPRPPKPLKEKLRSVLKGQLI